MSKAKKIILSILISFVVLIVLIISIKKDESSYFKQIEYNTYNEIKNDTQYPFIDTIVHMGLNELKLKNNYIIIADLTPYSDYLFIDNNITINAAIIGKNNQYMIFIKAGLTKDKVISVIAHELIHLQQYDNQELVVDNINQILYWKDNEYAFNYLHHIEYQERPWEKEAFLLEPDLTNSIKKILY